MPKFIVLLAEPKPQRPSYFSLLLGSYLQRRSVSRVVMIPGFVEGVPVAWKTLGTQARLRVAKSADAILRRHSRRRINLRETQRRRQRHREHVYRLYLSQSAPSKFRQCPVLDTQSDIPGATIHTNRILLNWRTIFTSGTPRSARVEPRQEAG